jgi:hypothetical protein
MSPLIFHHARPDATRYVCAFRYELRMLQLSEEAQRAGEGLVKLNYMYTVCLDKNEELKTKANTLQSQVPLCMCVYTTVYVLSSSSGASEQDEGPQVRRYSIFTQASAQQEAQQGEEHRMQC